MASGLSANTFWRVFVGGSDTNGGGFVTGALGTDYSQQNSPQYSLTGLTSSGAGNVLLYASASADMVGNIAYCSAGTNANTATWYQITSVSVGVSITFSTNLAGTSIATGAASGVAISIGGALGSPGILTTLMTVSNMQAGIKAGTYTLTTSTAGSGGPISTGATVVNIEGYQTTFGDRTGTMPVISWGSVSAPGSLTYIITCGNNSQHISNITANGTSTNNVGGFSAIHNNNSVTQCIAENCNGTGAFGYDANAVASEALSCGVGFIGSTASRCWASGCTTGYTTTTCYDSIAYNNTTGFQSNLCIGCIGDSNATDFNACNLCVNCIGSNASSAGNHGFSNCYVLETCAYYNNTTNATVVLQNENPVALTAQPYVTPGSQFAPNTTAGGGASLRGAGFAVATQVDNKDVGAVHHADPSGSSVYPMTPFVLGA